PRFGRGSSPSLSVTNSSSLANKSLRDGREPEAGGRGLPSPFINLDERGRETPHPSLPPLLPRKDLFAGIRPRARIRSAMHAPIPACFAAVRAATPHPSRRAPPRTQRTIPPAVSPQWHILHGALRFPPYAGPDGVLHRPGCPHCPDSRRFGRRRGARAREYASDRIESAMRRRYPCAPVFAAAVRAEARRRSNPRGSNRRHFAESHGTGIHLAPGEARAAARPSSHADYP